MAHSKNGDILEVEHEKIIAVSKDRIRLNVRNIKDEEKKNKKKLSKVKSYC